MFRSGVGHQWRPRRRPLLHHLLWCGIVLSANAASAQVNVITGHNDISRTGQNLSETILTPSNVNPAAFGKLFSQSVVGYVFAQPLYVSNVAIPGKGNHNVVYAATNGDYVYAFDAGNNGGQNATSLWKVNLATNTAPAGTYTKEYGVLGTPVIDLSTQTMYLVSSEEQGSTPVYRLHALDITSGAEKLGGPVTLQASVPGTGTGSSAGVLTFAPAYELQRPGLLELNGMIYMAFGSYGDNGPWHGWIFSYNAATLQQVNVFCTAPNGSGGGVWMGGAGLAAEGNNPASPYGRMFVATGNGSNNAAPPYKSGASYGMTMLDLDLTGGVMTVEDIFTPYNWSLLNSQDGDFGSGGPVLLPTTTLPSGQTLSPLVQIGKSGMFYILDRNNLGGINKTADLVQQEVQTPESGSQEWGAGVWGTTAYWNSNVYLGGTNPGVSNSLTAYSFVNGTLSKVPTSQSAEQFSYPGPTPSVSANGAGAGIVWVLTEDTATTGGSGILLAYDATNLGNLLYSSNANATRDTPGPAVKNSVPTIANGGVYVGSFNLLSFYGLLGVTPTVAAPVINPSSATFTGSQSVTITDATPGATIYYTVNGATPTVFSTVYSGPITVTTSETILAIASATGYLQGAPVSATFSSTANAANPVFALAAGTYSGTQSLSITDATPGAVVYYTVDGSAPSTSSSVYSAPISVPVSEVVKAFATAAGLQPSSEVISAYTIQPNYTFNFNQGFAQSQAQGLMQFNGSTDLDDLRLQLTNGSLNQAGSAFYTTPVNVQAFTTDFTFQLSNPVGDGITFTIQNTGLGALGGKGGVLGYGGIKKSVAIKFDILNNDGEGPNSTGLYLNGANPNMPSVSLVNSGIDLHSGDFIDAHVTYDGVQLNLTLTDETTLSSWSTSWMVDIPSAVNGKTAYVGFTGSTGSTTSSQKILSWSYLAAQPAVPNYTVGFDAVGLALNGGAALSGTNLQLTNGSPSQTTSAYFANPVAINGFTSDFDMVLTQAVGDGFTFVIQNNSPAMVGGGGEGLGYAGIPASVAIKFDLYNDDGEGNDSTGVYVNGAEPTMPSINVTNTKLVFASGDLIHVHITYDGTTLTWYMIDRNKTSPPTISEDVKLNIPYTIGSNTAYVGFTASTSTVTAIQNILDWTFTNP